MHTRHRTDRRRRADHRRRPPDAAEAAAASESSPMGKATASSMGETAAPAEARGCIVCKERCDDNRQRGPDAEPTNAESVHINLHGPYANSRAGDLKNYRRDAAIFRCDGSTKKMR